MSETPQRMGSAERERPADALARLGVPEAAYGWLLKTPRRAVRALFGRSRSNAIKAFCVDCAGGSSIEARKCPADDCPLWQFRPGAQGPPGWAKGRLKAFLEEL